jgi:NAD-dependent deacetylase
LTEKGLFERAVSALARARDVAVLTGAGVSRESGVHTFREKGGVWDTVDMERMASLSGFTADPKKVWSWYMDRYKSLTEARPNPGHYALAELERKAPSFTLITQNIDGLHQEAGSVNVVELHGSIRRTRCLEEGTVFESWPEPGTELPPMCRCGGMLRPDVVWFGEALPEDALARAFEKARECDLMLVVGTSAVVQPAGLLPLEARQAGAFVIEINPERTAISSYVDVSILEPSGSALPRLVAAAFK